MIHFINELPEQVLDAFKWVVIILTLKIAAKDLFDFMFADEKEYKTLTQRVLHRLRKKERG